MLVHREFVGGVMDGLVVTMPSETKSMAIVAGGRVHLYAEDAIQEGLGVRLVFRLALVSN